MCAVLDSRDTVQDAVAHLSVGRAARKQSNLLQAAASMRRALELEPGLSDAEHELGSVLVAMGSIDEAEQLYRSILSREELDAEVDTMHGVVTVTDRHGPDYDEKYNYVGLEGGGAGT